MRRIRFAERTPPNQYERDLTIAWQVECEDTNECFHDHYYLTEEQFKQLPGAALKFNVERKHDKETTTVSDGGNQRH